jgi:hypothetical protein
MYSNTDHYWPHYWLPYVKGVGAAPEQYRIGVKLAAWWLVKHLGWGFRHGFTLMDVIGSLTATFLLYDLLQRKSVVRRSSLTLQWFASAAFVMLAGFYLAWVGFFFRPETLPTTGLTTVMLWLWSPRDSQPNRIRQALTVCGLLAASAVQATIRADVPCLLNAGIFAVSLTRFGKELSLPKRLAVLTSGASIAVAVAIQLYIMRVAYPHASYGNIPILMVRYDLFQPLAFPPFLLFMVPLIWTGVQFWRQRRQADGLSIGLVFGSLLYLGAWIAMGKLDEVRIFVPFAMALIPLTIELALHQIRGDATSSVERAEA